jgi:16S rRNA processing protein RimM
MMVDGGTEIGLIQEVIEQPHQILCTVIYKGAEALVPLHEASLKKIDNKHKKVFVELPEGLLDIYSV